MSELWQLYDESNHPLSGQGASPDDVYGKGLLHGAAHVWISHRAGSATEVLLQKRSPHKRTWPNLYDISAAGHIDVSETPIAAAIRETQEEIGLTVTEDDLSLIGVYRAHLLAQNGSIENEFQWLYLLRLDEKPAFKLQDSEVAAMEWQEVDQFETAVRENPELYVPHGAAYYQTVIDAVNAL